MLGPKALAHALKSSALLPHRPQRVVLSGKLWRRKPRMLGLREWCKALKRVVVAQRGAEIWRPRWTVGLA